MKFAAQSLLAAFALALTPVVALAVNEPIIIQAESGTPIDTSVFSVITSVVSGETITFVRVNADFANAAQPGTASRVISYTVTFPAPGVYNLYARYRVGSGGANDDSFYYGNGFGAKDFNNGNDWITTNNLNGVGYSAVQNMVLGAGTGTGFKWLNLSAFPGGGEGPVQFTVPVGALTQTFQIGSRENGLDFDKLAFGPADVYYTVANLNAGQPGSTIPPPPPYTPPASQLPMATGKAKYLGSAYSAAQSPFFKNYWNQVTPENAGKWGSVEATRNVMNWTELDAMYAFAKANGFPFRFHVLVWGNQQPTWLKTLPPAEQLAEIEQWFSAVATRYPDIYAIDVVNEALHDPPTNQATDTGSGGYINALGGSNGTDGTGWDWVLNAFRLARLYFPPNVKLVLNDYSITNDGNATTTYLQIINILKAEGLIDMIGEQGHAFSTTGSMATHKANLDRLAATGLPITITEFDLDGLDDQTQLDNYKRVFPAFWEHPAVEGVTLWGWRPGHWRTAQGDYLVNDNGSERSALLWLMGYVKNNPPVVAADQAFSVPEGAANGTAVGGVAASDADPATTLGGWAITGGTGAAYFAINATTGALTVSNGAALNFEAATSYTLNVTVNDGYTNSAAATVTVNLSNANDNAPVVASGQSFVLGAGAVNTVGTATASDADDTNQWLYTTFQNWQVTGGTGAGLFAIDPATGTITISNPNGINFNLTSYTLVVRVGDGLNTSAPQTITITIPTTVRVTVNGRVVQSYKLSVPSLLRAGGAIGG